MLDSVVDRRPNSADLDRPAFLVAAICTKLTFRLSPEHKE